MPYYLENRVTLTPKFFQLMELLREEYTDYRVAKILDIHPNSWYNVINRKRHYKTIGVSAYENARNHLLEMGYTEKSLCRKLEVKSLDDYFLPAKSLNRKKVVARSYNFIKKAEISKGEFIRRLKASDLYLEKLGKQTFIDFLNDRWATVDPRLLTAVNSYLDSQKPEQLPKNAKPDYQKTMRGIESYLDQSHKTKTDFARELIEFNSSLGTVRAVMRWFENREPRPSKIRIIDQYLKHVDGCRPEQQQTKPTVALQPRPSRRTIDKKFVCGLYYIFNEGADQKVSLETIAAEAGLRLPAKNAYPYLLVDLLEKKVIDHYERTGPRKEKETTISDLTKSLPYQVLTNLFATSLCPSISDFEKRFTQIASYLMQTYRKGLNRIFESTLSSTPENELWSIADNLGIAVPNIDRQLETRESLKRSLGDYFFRKTFKKHHEEIVKEIACIKKDIIKQIMQKIS